MLVISAALGVARPTCRAEVVKQAASAADERGARGTGSLGGPCLVGSGMKLLVSLVKVRAFVRRARRVDGKARLTASFAPAALHWKDGDLTTLATATVPLV